MRTSVTNDIAYFLHQTPYRDNSAIVHLLTRKHGKVSLLVSGLKAKKHAKRPFLQPCKQLCLNYQLKNGLSKLTHIDFSADKKHTTAPSVAQFMFYQYANELLLTVLPHQLPTPTLFDDYAIFLQRLIEQRPHAALRHIELALLLLFSGLPNVERTEDTHQFIEQQQTYWFYPNSGLFSIEQPHERDAIILDGTQIQAFHHVSTCHITAQTQYISEPIAQGAKTLTTCLVNHLLNGKKLKTRKVYQALQAFV